MPSARQIPKHLQADAKAAVENLLQKGVIKRIDGNLQVMILRGWPGQFESSWLIVI